MTEFLQKIHLIEHHYLNDTNISKNSTITSIPIEKSAKAFPKKTQMANKQWKKFHNTCHQKNTNFNHHEIPLHMYDNGHNPEYWKHQMLVRIPNNRNAHSLLLLKSNSKLIRKGVWQFLIKLNLSSQQSLSLVFIQRNWKYVHAKTYTPLFIECFFITFWGGMLISGKSVHVLGQRDCVTNSWTVLFLSPPFFSLWSIWNSRIALRSDVLSCITHYLLKSKLLKILREISVKILTTCWLYFF